MAYKLKADKIVACRFCGRKIPEISKQCEYCHNDSPGIDSQCPKCGSKFYKYKLNGFSLGKALGGAILLGPLGLSLGLWGSSDIVCICNNCGYEWMPFAWGGIPSSTTSKNNI